MENWLCKLWEWNKRRPKKVSSKRLWEKEAKLKPGCTEEERSAVTRTKSEKVF